MASKQASLQAFLIIPSFVKEDIIIEMTVNNSFLKTLKSGEFDLCDKEITM